MIDLGEAGGSTIRAGEPTIYLPTKFHIAAPLVADRTLALFELTDYCTAILFLWEWGNLCSSAPSLNVKLSFLRRASRLYLI